MRCSISDAHNPTSLPIEHPPCSLRACKIRRRVGSATAWKMRSTSCSVMAAAINHGSTDVNVWTWGKQEIAIVIRAPPEPRWRVEGELRNPYLAADSSVIGVLRLRAG